VGAIEIHAKTMVRYLSKTIWPPDPRGALLIVYTARYRETEDNWGRLQWWECGPYEVRGGHVYQIESDGTRASGPIEVTGEHQHIITVSPGVVTLVVKNTNDDRTYWVHFDWQLQSLPGPGPEGPAATPAATSTAAPPATRTAAPPDDISVTVEPNTDRYGSDYRRLTDVPSADACRAACAADEACDAYAYVKSSRDCYLKKGVPSPSPNNGIVSGVKQRPPAVPPSKVTGGPGQTWEMVADFPYKPGKEEPSPPVSKAFDLKGPGILVLRKTFSPEVEYNTTYNWGGLGFRDRPWDYSPFPSSLCHRHYLGGQQVEYDRVELGKEHQVVDVLELRDAVYRDAWEVRPSVAVNLIGDRQFQNQWRVTIQMVVYPPGTDVNALCQYVARSPGVLPRPPRSANTPDLDDTSWIVNGHPVPWVFHRGGVVDSAGLWTGRWARTPGAIEVTITVQGVSDTFLVKLAADGKTFTAYKNGQVYRTGVRAAPSPSQQPQGAPVRPPAPPARPESPPAALPDVDISGVWRHGPGGETWTFTQVAPGKYTATERGFAGARGTATVSGNTIRIEYTYGYNGRQISGVYVVRVTPDGKTGQATWEDSRPGQGTATFVRVSGPATLP
jgi:hypothetical protein